MVHIHSLLWTLNLTRTVHHTFIVGGLHELLVEEGALLVQQEAEDGVQVDGRVDVGQPGEQQGSHHSLGDHGRLWVGQR